MTTPTITQSRPITRAAATGDLHDDLFRLGYVIRRFTDPSPLQSVARLCQETLEKRHYHAELLTYHTRASDQDAHLQLAEAATLAVNQSSTIEDLFRPEVPFLSGLLGPDLLIQAAPHLRIGRPGEIRDSIDLHRDSFYGSSVWHLNAWFPLVPLRPGCGLLLADGSHRIPSRNVREKRFDDEFRSSVTKGSAANRLGYVYRALTDDAIENLDPSAISLVAPPLGCYVLFFGCMIHGGVNDSGATRWTMDVRFTRPNDASSVKEGYFRPLQRGLISLVADDFYENSK